MKIEVAIKEDDVKKKKGDLLEELTAKLLENYNYKIQREIRNTGVEIDLLCENKANSSKIIYIECKAYNEDNPIPAETIYKLMGIKVAKEYEDAWLVSTTDLTKDGKGAKNEISKRSDASHYSIYTPDLFIEALISSKIIIDFNSIKQKVSGISNEIKIDEEFILFVTEYGYYWVIKCKQSGITKKVIFLNASNGDVIRDQELINNLHNVQSTIYDLDFTYIFELNNRVHINKNETKTLKFLLNKTYIQKINEMGIQLNHPGKDNLVLEDIFVYPDLEEIDCEDEKDKINSKSLLENDGLYRKSIIFGDSLSGKSSLATIFQKDLNTTGLIPIYINAPEIKKTDNTSFEKYLINLFKIQYSDNPQNIESFKEIISSYKDRVILIVDNFESIGVRRIELRKAFLDNILLKYNTILLSDKSWEIEALSRIEFREMLKDFKKFRIIQLGHVLRDKMIDKWLTLERSDSITEGELAARKNEISQKINVAIGTNLIPTYPLYILTVIQITDTGSFKQKLQGSSYAELYNYLINQALINSHIKPDDLDFYHTYMSFVAHNFYQNNIKELPSDAMEKLFGEYLSLMKIDKSFKEVHDLLGRSKLIKIENGYYSFPHNYAYYFFVAKYLSDNLEKTEIGSEIKEILEGLYKSENANIIIFLIHHSKNKTIIDQILLKSRQLFANIQPITLSKTELKNINDLINDEIKISMKDESPQNYRKKVLEEKDKLANQALDDKEGLESEDFFSKINLSFKLIEILGQITNNYYGSLEGSKKIEITNELNSLGLRTLSTFLKSFEEFIPTLQSEISDYITKKKLVAESEKEKAANSLITNFTNMILYVFIKKISDSVSSRNLTPIIITLVEENPTVANKLVEVSAKLNFPHELNADKIVKLDKELDGNYLIKALLRILVVEHLYKFVVNFAEKQSICNRLGIKLVSNSLITSAS